MTLIRRILLAAAVAATLAACSSGKSKPSAAPTTASTTVAGGATTTSPSTAPATSTSSTTPTTAAGPTRCHSSQLSAALTNVSGAAGTIYSHLTFTNKSATSCTMSGYPGVSFVDGAGHQIGSATPRLSGYGGTVTLAAGTGTAAALFLYHDAYVGTSTECATPVAASGLRVYPPGETAALFVADKTMACPNPAATGEADVSAVTTPASLPG